MRCMLATALLAAAAAAGPEPDGAVAEANRWVEPRGCASGSFRSRALPVVTEVEEAWRLDFESVEAPPVHWDGTGYVVARAAKKTCLVAFDLGTGKEIARVQLRDFKRKSGLLVWDHLVLLQPDDEQITGYRLDGRKFEIRWMFRGWDLGVGVPDRPRLPVVHENEVYCLLGGGLVRVRPGFSTPAWKTYLVARSEPGYSEPHAARPAVFGEYVFVASFGPPFEGKLPGQEAAMFSDVRLAVIRRTDGKRMLEETICQARAEEGVPPDLRIMVSASKLFIGSAWPLVAVDGTATDALVPLDLDGGVGVGKARLWTASSPPAYHPRLGAIFLSAPREGKDTGKDIEDLVRRLREGSGAGTRPAPGGLEWCAEREGKLFLLTSEAEQADCFRDRVTPTVLGDVAYFGSWAADLVTGDILWRLPLPRGAAFPPVPADRLVLVVDGGAVRAFRGRGRR